jgi:hypothetical protein
VRDGTGNLFLADVPVPAGQLMTVPIPEGGMQFNSLLISAAAPAQVYCWLRYAAPKSTVFNG